MKTSACFRFLRRPILRPLPLILLPILLFSTPLSAGPGTWTVMDTGTTAHLWDVFGFSSDNIYAVGNAIGDGVILHYDGMAWSLVPDPGGYVFYDLWGHSPDDIWVVGGFGVITHFDGVQWTQQALPAASNFISIHGLAGDNIMAVASDGAIIHYDGESWQEMPTSSPLELFDVFGRADNDWWAAGSGWTIHHCDGQEWTCVWQEGEVLWGIWASAVDNAWAGGMFGVIYHFDGTGWSEAVPAGEFPHVHGMWGTAVDDIYAVGSLGSIQHFDGDQWISQDSPTTQVLSGVWGLSTNEVFIAGEGGVILHLDKLTPVDDQIPIPGPALGAWPNPLNPGATVRFRLDAPAAVDLRVFDLKGHLVRVLLAGDQLDEGQHQLWWDGKSGDGLPLASGSYFLRLTGAGQPATIKVTLAR